MQNVLNWPRIWVPRGFNREKRIVESRIGVDGGMSGGMQDITGVQSQLLGSNLNYLNEQFTAASGTDLTSLTPASGGAWNKLTGTTVQIDTSGTEAYCSAGGSPYIAKYSVTSPSADYSVIAVVDKKSSLNAVESGVAARLVTGSGSGNGYVLRVVFISGTPSYLAWRLEKITNGADSQLSGNVNYNTNIFAGNNTIQLDVYGSQIIASVGGMRVSVVTDSTYTAAGAPGLANQGGQATDTTGFHWNSIISQAYTAGSAFSADADSMTHKTASTAEHWTDGAFPADIQPAPLWNTGDSPAYVEVYFDAAITYNVTISGGRNTNIGSIAMYDQVTSTSTGSPAGSTQTPVSFNGATGALYNQAMGSFTISSPGTYRVWFAFTNFSFYTIKKMTFTP